MDRLYRLDGNGKLLKFLRIFTLRSGTESLKPCLVLTVLWSVKYFFCSEFPNIPDKAARVKRKRRTQALAKRFAFYTNAKSVSYF